VIAQTNDGPVLPRPAGPDAGAVSGPARSDAARVQRLLRRYARCCDPAARDELVRRFLPLVHRLARRYHRGPEPFDDVAQIGSIGLPTTIDRLQRVLQHMKRLAAGTDRREVLGAPRERPKNGRPSSGPSRKSLPQELISCTSSPP
jgi:hypothetical protein